MKLKTNTNKPEEQLYDLSLIDKMCRGNQKQIEEMIQVFISQISKSIENLKLAGTKNELLKIKTIVHKIKPSFTYYRTVKLKKEVEILEALILGAFEKNLLELKIDTIVELSVQIIHKMKNDFNITSNKNDE